MEQPIVNPPNPYVGNLRIFPGTLVKVAGRPRPNATRFAINFQTGPSINPRDDLALHLSPCFTPPRVIRNSLINGAWGLEEAWGNGSLVNPHAPFEIMILAEQDQFKIAINGSHYCEFRHRIPYQQVTHLSIDGDLDIDRISVTAPDSSYRAPQSTAGAYQPTAPPPASMPPRTTPYPTGPTPGMPMPPMYPTLNPQPMAPSHYPSVPSMPPGPMPTPASYASGPYPAPQAAGPYPGAPTSGGYQPQYPQVPPAGGPPPAPSGYYQGGYPQQPQPHHQPGSSSTSTPFGNLPIGGKALGTIAGLGLGAAAGAAALSALNPLKKVKKIMKPHKAFGSHKWGRSSSSSSSGSNSSRGSFSSNSS